MLNFFSENRAVYEIMWENVVQRGRPHDTCTFHVGYLRLLTHSQYVIIIVCPLQQWLQERALMLRYT